MLFVSTLYETLRTLRAPTVVPDNKNSHIQIHWERNIKKRNNSSQWITVCDLMGWHMAQQRSSFIWFTEVAKQQRLQQNQSRWWCLSAPKQLKFHLQCARCFTLHWVSCFTHLQKYQPDMASKCSLHLTNMEIALIIANFQSKMQSYGKINVSDGVQIKKSKWPQTKT